MPVENDNATDLSRRATVEDVRHVLGNVEDTIVVAVLAAQPSFQDLSEAAIWVRGDGDLLAREHKALSGGALAVAEILARDEDAVLEEPH